MHPTKIVSLLTVIALCSVQAWGKDEKSSAEKVQDGASAIVNEIGKGLQAVGKAVGPAVEKGEKTVRGGRDESTKENKKDK